MLHALQPAAASLLAAAVDGSSAALAAAAADFQANPAAYQVGQPQLKRPSSGLFVAGAWMHLRPLCVLPDRCSGLERLL